jgi:ATP-dependent Lon protease
MATAIASVFSGRAVRKEVAMTGEITLRGKVLRIGGLKEKAIAAHRAGCQEVIIPAENERDLVELPAVVRQEIKFWPIKTVAEALDIALEKKK